jgi:hypothetical protein
MTFPRKSRLVIVSAAGTFICSGIVAPVFGQSVPSFPGADGAGATATGGRGGSVYHVTVLDTKLGDLTPGTLQYGLKNATGPTTIVFDVGGTIWLGLKTTDVEGWDTQNSLNIPANVTIAGQTAPGGITFMGSQIKFNGQTVSGQTLPFGNDIFRNVTMAVGYGMRKANGTSGYYDNYTYDNVDVNSSNVIIDHSAALYATDEAISSNEMANKVTVQYTAIAQGQSYPQADAQGNGNYDSHAFGDLWSMGSNAISTFSHNLYANENGRIPAIQTVASKLTNNVPAYTDFRNNVVYNWFGYAGYGSGGEPGAGEFEGNYYKVGPGGDEASGNNTDFSIHNGAGGSTVFKNSSSTFVYQSANVLQNGGSTTNLVNSNFGSANTFQSGPYTQIPYNGITDTAANALTQVTNYVGPDWQSRDPIDQRLVYEAIHGTGKIAALDDPSNGFVDDPGNPANDTYVAGNGTGTANNEWNTLLSLRNAANGGTGATGTKYTRETNFDTDGDGMPDAWEKAIGTNPAVADNNGNKMNNGYTNLENYLNDVGAFPASAPLAFNNANGTGRYAEIGNWQTGVFQPSRFDVAQIDSGTATVDVPDQHAQILGVGTSSSASGILAVTGGWIDITQSIFVAPGGAGTVNQSGGIVHCVSGVVLGGTIHAGTYNLSGGTLSTGSLSSTGQGGVFHFTGGVLHAGTVGFSLTDNGGTLAPGSDSVLALIAAAAMPDINDFTYTDPGPIGNTHVAGNLTMASGTLQIELLSDTSNDSLTIDQQLTLGGMLEVDALGSYTPTSGNKWLIATANSFVGSFGAITPGYSTQIVGNSLFLLAVPEPASLAVVGLAGVLGLRRSGRGRSRG